MLKLCTVSCWKRRWNIWINKENCNPASAHHDRGTVARVSALQEKKQQQSTSLFTNRSYFSAYFSLPTLLPLSISQSYFLVENSLPITRLNLPCPIFGAFLIEIHVLPHLDRILRFVTFLSSLCLCVCVCVCLKHILCDFSPPTSWLLSCHFSSFSSFTHCFFPQFSSLIILLFLLYVYFYYFRNTGLFRIVRGH
jgi:hypothetical protein